LFYSINQTDTWVVIATDVNGTSFEWDTTTLVTSFVYQIKIVAKTIYESQILTNTDVSDNYFTVANRKVTIELDIPETLPENVSSTPGFELPLILLVAISIFIYRRKRR